MILMEETAFVLQGIRAVTLVKPKTMTVDLRKVYAQVVAQAKGTVLAATAFVKLDFEEPTARLQVGKTRGGKGDEGRQLSFNVFMT